MPAALMEACTCCSAISMFKFRSNWSVIIELPNELVRGLPRYPNLPATLIGRLAVDTRYHRKGFGEELLLDALKRCLAATSEVGSLAVVVEAENKNALQFYQSYGFIPFPGHEGKLFLLMPTIRVMFEK